MAVGWKKSAFVNLANGNGIGFAVSAEGFGISDALIEPRPDGSGQMRLTTHPETGVEFRGYKIPFMKEAVELACQAHKALAQIPFIGWDVGILDDGPIIIEGNGWWGTATYQAIADVGERDFFEKHVALSDH